MASIVPGSVTVSDAGVATFTPSGSGNSLAGAKYAAYIETNDDFTVAQGGEVLPNDQRVATLRYYALLATNEATREAAYLNSVL